MSPAENFPTMWSLLRNRSFSISFGAALAVTASGPAFAQAAQACADLPGPIIYGVGGSAQRPVLSKFAAKLRGTITVVYAAPGACNAITYLRDGTKLKGTANYWEVDGTQKTCDLPIPNGVDVSYGFMGNSELGCDGVSALPANIRKYQGPVETANFIVPAVGSPENAISAEAAYFVFGFGGTQGRVDPWDNDSFVIGRDKNSFLTITLSKALGIDLNKFKATDAQTNERTVALVSGATNPGKAIGVVAGEIAAAYRASVKTLAYQHFDQSCGYWPDSDANKLDKRSVRDGLYFLWSAVNLFIGVDPATKAPVDANAEKLAKYFALEEPLPGDANALELQIKSSLTPRCAMHVWRDGDAAPLYSYAPPEPCGCYFEATATGDAPASCTACTDDAGCGGANPKCRLGYCEAY